MSRVDETFASMGGTARVRLESEQAGREELDRHLRGVRAVLEAVEASLSRFIPDSDLNRLNRDPAEAVGAPTLVRLLAGAVARAGRASGGLVDATLTAALEEQGYRRTLAGSSPPSLADALAAAPERRRAHPATLAAFDRIEVDASGRVVRPPGVRIDSGGLAKGLAADLAASRLPAHVRYAISCGGDLAVGSPPGSPAWGVAVTGALSDREEHRLVVAGGGVATSGIHTRLWRRPDGTYAHHLLDPSTGRPAWTGLVAATAVGGNALDAEVLAKTALLSGPDRGRRVLARAGGVLQHEDGSVQVVPARPRVPISAKPVGVPA